jgi:hypothetical protein
MPNIIAYAVLLAWPLVAWLLAKRFKDSADKVLFLVVIPYLFLPVKTAVDLPLLPSIDKFSLSALVAYLLMRRGIKTFKAFTISRGIKIALIAILIGPVCTIFFNSEPLQFIGASLPGLKAWDLIGLTFVSFTSVFIPFLLGAFFLNTAESHRRILYWLALGGLLYLLPVLWEVRMSPQLHAQIYGFFPHDFSQQIRSGGFRPVVFLGHGLLVAFFMCGAGIAALVLWRNNMRIGYFAPAVTFILMTLAVFLCKTLSVLIYFIPICFLIYFVKPKIHFQIAAAVMAFIMLYPALRESATPLLRDLVIQISNYNEERSRSLEFRLNNEEVLLAKANEKPLFGWGSWGRNAIYDDYGKMTSITDGYWIIVFGSYGWAGYLSFFALLFFPLWQWRKLLNSNLQPEALLYSSAIALLMLANAIDFIPNAAFSPLTLLLAGALYGRARLLTKPIDHSAGLKPDV